ncbi:short-chain fatty acid transporter [Haloarchaeobius sp. HRN-SO-5]|uniref:short-chain fatty acid transporter n=1 Tax=Haloarchaeobius sp. HRN-SO-5 TaxID=3446118 RepID=UPI003EB7BEAB
MATSDTGGDTGGTFIERLGYRLSAWVERWMPSPFLFAIILTYIVFVAGLVTTDAGPGELVGYWYGGFWAFLQFSMQMVLILMTGFVVAYHPRVNAGIQRLTLLPSTGKQAVVLVAVVTMLLGWVHWGLSLILGAIFAREMGKTAREEGIDVHYPVLCVAGYMGLGLTWHWGLSASAPLLIATEGNEFISQGVLDAVVPASETIFHPYALILTFVSIVYASAVFYLLTPSGEDARGISHYVDESELETGTSGPSPGEEVADGGTPVASETVPADRINNSRVLGFIIAVTGVGVVVYQFIQMGINALSLNVVNFGFLMTGVLIYLRPQVYRDRFGDAATAAAGIILLFPFFAGIQGMMASSGLAELVAQSLIDISSPATFPVVAWLSGAVVNLFVPSGGGEWIVLGPSIIGAAQDLGVPVGQATIAYAVGDAHTNLLNPFWALPLLAITGIKAREMFGYAIAMLLALIPFLAVILYVLPY